MKFKTLEISFKGFFIKQINFYWKKEMQEIIKIFFFFSHIFNGSLNVLSETRLQEIFEQKNATIQELNALAQKHFLRPKNAERMSTKAIEHYKKLCSGLSLIQKKQIISLFYDFGYISSIYPKNNMNPDIILIQGSTVQNMRERLMFLAKIIQKDVVHLKKETQIVFLAGERKLFPTETKEVLLNPEPYVLNLKWSSPKILPKDEREAAKLVWNQLELPLVLREKTPLFIEATKQQGETRAQTMDCIQLWLQHNIPQSQKKVLMVSNNPYVQYQMNVTELGILKAGLSDYFDVEGIGRSFDVNEDEDIDITIGILMDTLARVLYVKNQSEELKQIYRVFF